MASITEFSTIDIMDGSLVLDFIVHLSLHPRGISRLDEVLPEKTGKFVNSVRAETSQMIKDAIENVESGPETFARYCDEIYYILDTLERVEESYGREAHTPPPKVELKHLNVPIAETCVCGYDATVKDCDDWKCASCQYNDTLLCGCIDVCRLGCGAYMGRY